MPLNRRTRTRRAALQALYQWQMTGHSVDDLRAQFREDPPPGGFDPEFFGELITGVINDVEALDAILAPSPTAPSPSSTRWSGRSCAWASTSCDRRATSRGGW